MGRLYVCSLTKVIDTVRASGARSLVTILTAGASFVRPTEIAPQRHLRIAVSDIEAPLEAHLLADAEHIETLLAFARAWDRNQPLLIHCYAGVSRSPAAAFVTACALAPRRAELDVARALRRASPTATPNRRLVTLADRVLGRHGR
ncbi:MAG: protein tyrosine phosphatase, partial [Methylocystis sp.]|nr:protein tyrosine phosphatase [Methylocystis sp.]